MRVIAGVAKGTRLEPAPSGIRPVTDRAREGLFASLGERVRDAQVLDLFAGTGALGIEALSRGASRAVFVDRSREAGAVITENLRRTRMEEEGVVRVLDVASYLRKPGSEDGSFDLVFLDPPYSLGAEALAGHLEVLASSLRLAEGWTVIVTRGQKGSLPAAPLHWDARRQLRYGDSLLICYREVGWA